MGIVVSAALAGKCWGDCAKYVCNAGRCKSSGCGVVCDCEMDKVELEDSASETGIEVGCLKMHHK